jgi:hypothetical protein
MKLGFIIPNLPGHLNLMIALARQLLTRNHDVVLPYLAGAVGLPFIFSDKKGRFEGETVAFAEFRVLC